MIVDISREKVGQGSLGACAKEGALRLSIMKASGEKGGGFLEAISGGVKEVISELFVTNWEAKDTSTIDEFWLWVTVRPKIVEGVVKVLAVSWGEVG